MLQRPAFVRAYGAAHFGKSLLWHVSQILFAFILTEAAGFSPDAMGMMLASALLLNAVADIVVGKALERRVRTLRSAAQPQLPAALLAGVSLLLVGASATIDAEALRPGLAVAGLFLFALAYAALDVPQNTLLGLVGGDDCARASLSSLRLFLSGAAQLTVVLAFVPLMRSGGGDALGIRFFWLSTFIAGAAVTGAAMLARVDGGRGAAQAQRAMSTGGPGLAALLAMMALFSLATALVVRIEPYVAAYWFRSSGDGAVFMIAIAAGGMASQPLWMARTRSGRPLLMEAAGLFALGGFAFGFAAEGPFAAALAGLVLGSGQGGITMLLWTYLAGLAGSRPGKATFVVGSFTFVAKAAGAFATMILAHALGAGGYRSAGSDLSILVLLLMAVPAFGALALILLNRNRKQSANLTLSVAGE